MRIQFGDVTFDSEARQLTGGRKLLHLSPKAFQVLQVLIEERPRVVSKAELMERLWPDVVLEDANLKNLLVHDRRDAQLVIHSPANRAA